MINANVRVGIGAHFSSIIVENALKISRSIWRRCGFVFGILFLSLIPTGFSALAQSGGSTPLAEWQFFYPKPDYWSAEYPSTVKGKFYPDPETACSQGMPLIIDYVGNGTVFFLYQGATGPYYNEPKYSSTRPYGPIRYPFGVVKFGHKCAITDMYVGSIDPPFGDQDDPHDSWEIYENGQSVTQSRRVDDEAHLNQHYNIITKDAWVGHAAVVPVCRNGGAPIVMDGTVRCGNAPAPVLYENQDNDCRPGDNPIGGPPDVKIGNPISLDSGTKRAFESDYRSADGLLRVDRQYSCRGRNPLYARTPLEIPGFGLHWHGVIPGFVSAEGAQASSFAYHAPNGSVRRFTVTGDGTALEFIAYDQTRLKMSLINAPADLESFLQEQVAPDGGADVRLDFANGEYILFRRGGDYDASHQRRTLVPVEHGKAGGYKLWFDYPDNGAHPYRVRDSFGRQLTLTWTELGWSHNSVAGLHEGPNQSAPLPGYTLERGLSRITLPDGNRLEYRYGRNDNSGYLGRLEAVWRKSAAGTILWARYYKYEDPRFPSAITAINDQLNNRLSAYAYDDQGRAVSTERADGVDKQQIAYSATEIASEFPQSSQKVDIRTVTNPLGLVTEFQYSAYEGNSEIRVGPEPDRTPRRLQKVEVKPGVGVAGSVSETQYSVQGQISGRTDANGNSIQLDPNDESLRPSFVINALGERTELAWSPELDLPTSIRHANGLVERYEYSPEGQLISRSFGSEDFPAQTARATRYSWGVGGRLLSVNGPRDPDDYDGTDDITAFTYDASGNRLTMTNALGHVTTYAAHDANGNPGEMTDPNGIRTVFTYDRMGRLVTSIVKDPHDPSQDATTRYEYDYEGRIVGLTRPDSAKLTVDYDLAGRMTSLRSSEGERIDYAYDSASNVLSETVKRADGSQARGIQRTFDGLSRMLSETLGPSRTTRWQYDNNGNQTQVTTPRLNITSNSFDALDRLVSFQAPSAGTVRAGYDSDDNVTSFKDGIGVTTRFTYNVFGDVTKEVSPDRGTTTYTYDDAGDLRSITDGRGVTVSYENDILGRVVRKLPGIASEAIRYGWDEPDSEKTYRIGRLTKIRDASGTMTFNYDHRGNLTTQKQQSATGGDPFILRYAYDLADRVIKMTYPSGRQVQYKRDEKGRVRSVLTRVNDTFEWTPLASGMKYEPFGPLSSVHFGNGLEAKFDWGNDGRLALRRLHRSIDGSDLSRLTYQYDEDDNITRIVDRLDGAKTQSYAYDKAGRIKRIEVAAGAVQRVDYTYDNNGNRLTQDNRALTIDTNPVSSDSYNYTAGTNRLVGIAGPSGTRAIAYDGRGNTSGETRPDGINVTTAYDAFARLTGYQRSDTALTFFYNGRDDRVGMLRDGVQRWFVYDPEGRVIGEYGANGPTEVKAEFIWTLPEVGEAEAFGGDDGLGGYQPLAIAAPSGQAGVGEIEWVYGNHLGVPLLRTDASGTALTAAPDYLVSGFPGQSRVLPDLYYNRYRDFDPTTGRYIQGDSIGLSGGDNPYLYANGNPVSYIDPTGEFGIPGAVLGGLGDLAFQKLIEGRSWRCISWTQVGLSTAAGALTGGTASAIRLGNSWRRLGRSMTSANARKRYRRAMDASPGDDVHHWLIPESQRSIPQSIRNHPANFNLVPRPTHRGIHNEYGPVRSWWFGWPDWAKMTMAGPIAGVGGDIADSDCGC